MNHKQKHRKRGIKNKFILVVGLVLIILTGIYAYYSDFGDVVGQATETLPSVSVVDDPSEFELPDEKDEIVELTREQQIYQKQERIKELNIIIAGGQSETQEAFQGEINRLIDELQILDPPLSDYKISDVGVDWVINGRKVISTEPDREGLIRIRLLNEDGETYSEILQKEDMILGNIKIGDEEIYSISSQSELPSRPIVNVDYFPNNKLTDITIARVSDVKEGWIINGGEVVLVRPNAEGLTEIIIEYEDGTTNQLVQKDDTILGDIKIGDYTITEALQLKGDNVGREEDGTRKLNNQINLDADRIIIAILEQKDSDPNDLNKLNQLVQQYKDETDDEKAKELLNQINVLVNELKEKYGLSKKEKPSKIKERSTFEYLETSLAFAKDFQGLSGISSLFKGNDKYLAEYRQKANQFWDRSLKKFSPSGLVDSACEIQSLNIPNENNADMLFTTTPTGTLSPSVSINGVRLGSPDGKYLYRVQAVVQIPPSLISVVDGSGQNPNDIVEGTTAWLTGDDISGNTIPLITQEGTSEPHRFLVQEGINLAGEDVIVIPYTNVKLESVCVRFSDDIVFYNKRVSELCNTLASEFEATTVTVAGTSSVEDNSEIDSGAGLNPAFS